jgi:hypothetical protein
VGLGRLLERRIQRGQVLPEPRDERRPRGREPGAPPHPLEQRHPHARLQRLELLSHGGRGDAQARRRRGVGPRAAHLPERPQRLVIAKHGFTLCEEPLDFLQPGAAVLVRSVGPRTRWAPTKEHAP